jgi:thiol-disulfide isomerase/thioredoxin
LLLHTASMMAQQKAVIYAAQHTMLPVVVYQKDIRISDDTPTRLSAGDSMGLPVLGLGQFYLADGADLPLFINPSDKIGLAYSNSSYDFFVADTIRYNELVFFKRLAEEDRFAAWRKSLEPVPVANKNFAQDDRLYFSKFKKHLPQPPPNNKIRDSLLFNNYTMLLDYISAYASAYTIGPGFKRNITQFAYYNYLNKSSQPYLQNSGDDVSPRLKSAFDSIIKSADDALLSMDVYRFSLTSAIIYKFRKTKASNIYTEAMLKFIHKEVGSNQCGEYLLFFFTRKALIEKSASPNTHKMLGYYSSIAKAHSYISELKQIALTTLNRPKDKQDRLLNSAGKEISLSQLLKQRKDSVVLIDLWASWCMPCLEEFPASVALQKEMRGKNLSVLYISLDANIVNWQKLWAKENHHMNEGNSFFLLSNFNSSFAKKYNIKTLPRYLLFDRNGNLITTNAPRPSDPALKKLLLQYLK